jgi:hypothetical protein
MLGKPFLRQIAKIRGLRMHLLAGGLMKDIREYLKSDPNEGDGVGHDQLAFWPAALRPLVKDIDRARVFVPARGEFVMLNPKAISKEEVSESGDYLIAKGEDCIRVGKRLKELARRM